MWGLGGREMRGRRQSRGEQISDPCPGRPKKMTDGGTDQDPTEVAGLGEVSMADVDEGGVGLQLHARTAPAAVTGSRGGGVSVQANVHARHTRGRVRSDMNSPGHCSYLIC